MKPLHIDRISAVFSWNKRKRYEFVVKSQNAKGESANSSTIVIPPLPSDYEGSTSPEWIKNEYDPTKHTYSLSWSPPKHQEGLIDYTVFWCQSKKATPNECEVCVAQNYTNKPCHPILEYLSIIYITYKIVKYSCDLGYITVNNSSKYIVLLIR